MLAPTSPGVPLSQSPARVRPLWWQWPTVLSLEAPAVAVSWQILFAQVCETELRGVEVALLASAVWLAYVADRWLDGVAAAVAGESVNGPGLAARHLFLAERSAAVLVLWSIVLAGSLLLASWALTPGELARGGVVAAAVVGYLGLIHLGGPRRRLGRQVQIALLFVAGVALFTVPGHRGWSVVPLLAGFGALCWLNCALIRSWERAATPVAEGGRRLRRLRSWGLALAAFGVALWWGGEGLYGASLALAASGLVLVDRLAESSAIVVHSSERAEWLHALADAALASPVPLLLGGLLGGLPPW